MSVDINDMFDFGKLANSDIKACKVTVVFPRTTIKLNYKIANSKDRRRIVNMLCELMPVILNYKAEGFTLANGDVATLPVYMQGLTAEYTFEYIREE